MIPNQFRSEETQKEFTNCLVCNCDLLQEACEYMVEKSYRNIATLGTTELLFEYAICVSCAQQFSESLSEESRSRIAAYMQGAIRNLKPTEGSERLLSCLVKNTPIEKSAEYQVVAHCTGKGLTPNSIPFAISLEAMDEIAELLSDKSRDELDGFIGRYFTGPPEVADVLRRRPVLV